MKVITIPSQDELINGTSIPFPYTKDFDTGRRDGAFASHTSGSTGVPSPRVYTHEFIARAVRNILLPPPKGYTSLGAMTGQNKQLLLLPLFHPAGVQFGTLNAIFNRTVIVFPSPSAPPSVEGLVGMMQNTEADWAVMAPSMLEALAKDPVLLEKVSKHLKLLVFSGGSLPKPMGDVIASKIKLASFLGSSETAGYPTIFPHNFDATEDWQYAHIHPAAGVEFEQQVTDEFELVVKRSVIAEPYQPVFEVFPDLTEYRTKDIFTRHSKWPDMWMHASRSDDIIVFLNGEKTNPVTFENDVSQHPEVTAAIVFGQQRFEAGLLVEPKERGVLLTKQRAALIDRIWPTIERANQDAPAHARISKDHILIVNSEKPVERTAKETIKRKATLAKYSKNIDALYADAEKTWVMPSALPSQQPDLSDTVAIAEIIQTKVKAIAGLDMIGPYEDFFTRGIDSLVVLRLVRDLRASISVEQLQPGTVYLHSNTVSLAQAIHDLAQTTKQTEQEQNANRRLRLTEILNSHFRIIDQQADTLISQGHPLTHQPLPSNTLQTVILTGSTGTIGSYLLRALLAHPEISHIYCLNRSASSETKQRIHNAQTDPTLPTSFPADRVTFLEAELSNSTTLGLAAPDFARVSNTATLIIHNAWPINFHLPLGAFAKQLASVTNLCGFAARAARRPTILFLSSIAAAMGVGYGGVLVKEDVLEELDAPAVNGYAESKYVAERVLARAAERLLVRVKIARAGQVCGPARSRGLWKKEEWVPSLVLGGRFLGALPESLGMYGPEVKDVDWVPVDVLADVLIEIGMPDAGLQVDGTKGTGLMKEAQVFHPFKQPCLGWVDLVPAVVEAINSTKSSHGCFKGDLQVVSPADWLARLRTSAASAIDEGNADQSRQGEDPDITFENNPALKLLDFYQNKLGESTVLRWETGKAEQASRTLREASGISLGMMKCWVQDWVDGS